MKTKRTLEIVASVQTAAVAAVLVLILLSDASGAFRISLLCSCAILAVISVILLYAVFRSSPDTDGYIRYIPGGTKKKRRFGGRRKSPKTH